MAWGTSGVPGTRGGPVSSLPSVWDMTSPCPLPTFSPGSSYCRGGTSGVCPLANADPHSLCSGFGDIASSMEGHDPPQPRFSPQSCLSVVVILLLAVLDFLSLLKTTHTHTHH